MTVEQRKLVANGLINLGNIAAGLLIFGQFITGKSIYRGAFIMGLIALVLCYIITGILVSGGET